MKYYLPSELETVDDVRHVYGWDNVAPRHDRRTAELIAELWYSYQGICFPLTVALVSDDGRETQWVVQANVSTTFSATEVTS